MTPDAEVDWMLHSSSYSQASFHLFFTFARLRLALFLAGVPRTFLNLFFALRSAFVTAAHLPFAIGGVVLLLEGEGGRLGSPLGGAAGGVESSV